MTRYAAFLRGINLGNRRVRMDDLRAHVEAAGMERVATFIASGNVVFSSGRRAASLEARLERHLHDALGYEVDTFVRSLDELDAVLRHPFEDEGAPGEGAGIYVIFLKKPPPDGTGDRLAELDTDDDVLRLRGREAYWLRRGRFSDSTVTTAALGRALGGATTTTRNLNTLQRLAAKFSSQDSP